MISFLTKGLILALGYAYPAYDCYKTVEKNRPDIEQLRFWCQYWILVAVLTIFERVGEAFISWLPMYSEAKLVFFIYLWYPRTRGSVYVYESLLRPYVASHEREIDESLVEFRVRTGDMIVLFCQKAVGYGQTRIFEILQYVAAQSVTSTASSPQQHQLPAHPPPPITIQQSQPSSLSPQPSLTSNQVPEISAHLSLKAATAHLSGGAATSPTGGASAGEKVNTSQEIIMEEAVRVNHSRLRARPSAG